MSEAPSSDQKLTTQDGIVVRVGQTWRNCDKRMNGQLKSVIAVSATSGKAQLAGPAGLWANWVLVRRMHKSSTGWELVE